MPTQRPADAPTVHPQNQDPMPGPVPAWSPSLRQRLASSFRFSSRKFTDTDVVYADDIVHDLLPVMEDIREDLRAIRDHLETRDTAH